MSRVIANIAHSPTLPGVESESEMSYVSKNLRNLRKLAIILVRDANQKCEGSNRRTAIRAFEVPENEMRSDDPNTSALKVQQKLIREVPVPRAWLERVHHGGRRWRN